MCSGLYGAVLVTLLCIIHSVYSNSGEKEIKENNLEFEVPYPFSYEWDNTNDFEEGSRTPCPGWVCFHQRKPPTGTLSVRKVNCGNVSSWPEDKHRDVVWAGNRACTPCGVTNLISKVQLIDGEETSRKDFPWVVAIFAPDKRTGNLTVACSGTIISPHLILSAAHCFVVDRESHTLVFHKAKDLKIGFDVENFDQFKDDESRYPLVKRFTIGEGFAGPDSMWSRDMAILTLVKRLSFSSDRSPACINWNFPITEPHTSFVVGGFRETENRSLPLKLFYRTPFFTSYRACRDNLTSLDRVAFTQDKLCISDGKDVKHQEGYGGEGLVQLKENISYVVGFHSLRTPSLASEHYSLYTIINAPGIRHCVVEKWDAVYPDIAGA